MQHVTRHEVKEYLLKAHGMSLGIDAGNLGVMRSVMSDYITFRASVSDLSWQRGLPPSSSVYFQLMDMSRQQ